MRDEAAREICRNCRGEGWLPRRKLPDAHMSRLSDDGNYAKCPRCNGSGSEPRPLGPKVALSILATTPARTLSGSLIAKSGEYAGAP